MVVSLSAFSFLLLAAQGVPSGGRITGWVTDATSGSPLGGVRVTLTVIVEDPDGGFGRRPHQAITDANGRFAFEALVPAQYLVNVEKTGFAPYPEVFGEGPPDRLTVESNDTVVELRIALKRGAVIAGRIVNTAGEPEADLQVAALKRTDKAGPLGFAQVGNGQTNDLGEFRIAGLPSGDYRIVAAAQRRGLFDAIQTGATTLAATFFPGTPDQNAASTVTLISGQVVTDIEFPMATATAFRVSGIVVDQSGRPAPHAMVILVANMSAGAFPMPAMAMAADDGRFEIGQVIPGTYHINANVAEEGAGGGFGSVSFEMAVDGGPAGPDAIIVRSADVTGLRVTAKRN